MLEDGADIQVNERIFRDKLAKHTLELTDIQSIKKEEGCEIQSDSDEEEEEGVTQALQHLRIDKSCSRSSNSSTHRRVAVSPSRSHQRQGHGHQAADEQDDCSDLLAYYALQKS